VEDRISELENKIEFKEKTEEFLNNSRCREGSTYTNQ
jgi:uncharacterized coiled-coil protein SlyX